MILLVEDDPDHELLTIRALNKSNVANTVRVARDGAEAIELLFGDECVRPQVILLDLKLPKVDGLEVLRRIRESEATRMLPVVVLTSSDEERDVVRSYQLGVNSYIRKPVNFNDFAEATRQLGMYWLVLNECPRRARTGPRERTPGGRQPGRCVFAGTAPAAQRGCVHHQQGRDGGGDARGVKRRDACRTWCWRTTICRSSAVRRR